MVESTTLQEEGFDINPDEARSEKRYVMTIGDYGHGKSTFNNALLGESKNMCNDIPYGCTQDFVEHVSIFPEFENTIFIDSPGLNDP